MVVLVLPEGVAIVIRAEVDDPDGFLLDHLRGENGAAVVLVLRDVVCRGNVGDEPADGEHADHAHAGQPGDPRSLAAMRARRRPAWHSQGLSRNQGLVPSWSAKARPAARHGLIAASMPVATWPAATTMTVAPARRLEP